MVNFVKFIYSLKDIENLFDEIYNGMDFLYDEILIKLTKQIIATIII